VFDGSNNTSRSHSLPYIAPYPCNNLTGSWQFLNITMGSMIRRSNWCRMVTTQVVMDKINKMLAVVPLEEEAVVPGQDIPVVETIPEEPTGAQASQEVIEPTTAE
jgi:hypothetical protein